MEAPNQKLEDSWSISLPLERGELRVWEWNRYIRKYGRSLKLVEDWNESSEIRHLLKDVLPRPLEEKGAGRGEEESKEALGRTDNGIGGHPRRINGVSPPKPRRAQPNVGVEERRLRGGIRRHHGAKADAPQQRGVTYDFGSCFFPKFKVMHFHNGDIKLYTVVLLFLCFLKILKELCCRWSWSRRSTVNNCRVREFQIPDRRAQQKNRQKVHFFFAVGSKVKG